LVIEQRDSTRLAELDQQRLEVRSHVLTFREGELDSRLRDRTIEDLNLRLRKLSGVLRKEQATRELLSREITELQSARAPKSRRAQRTPKGKTAIRTKASKKAITKKRKSSKRRR